MPIISDRGQCMPESPIRKLVPFANEAKRQGKKIYHLNIGQPDILTPEVAIAAVKNMEKKVIEYSDSAGYAAYRAKMLGYYARLGIELQEDQILVTTGASEAISFALVTCLNFSNEIIVPEPFYPNYYGFTYASGVTIVPVTSTIDTGFALPPISEFEKAISPRTRAIMLCNPNNPTGYVYSKEELLQLAALVKKYDLYLFCDEVYREFCYDGQEHFSVLNIPDMDDNIVLFDSVSKRYSACGVRVGALISRNRKVINTALKFGQARLSPPGIGQLLGEAALDTPDDYFEEVEAEYIKRRDYSIRRLNSIAGVEAPSPRGAFYAMVKLPVDNSDRFCQWMLSDFSYNNATVMMAPGSGFYATPGLGGQEVRIAYVLNVNDLEKAFDCLEKGLEAYPGRKL